MGILKTIKERWCSETPNFFIGVKKLAISVGSSATTVWMTNEAMGLGLHDDILSICKYIIAFSSAMGVTAQLTQVTPPSEQEENI